MNTEPEYKVMLDGKPIDMTFNPEEIDALSEDINIFKTLVQPLKFTAGLKSHGKLYTKVTSFIGLRDSTHNRSELNRNIEHLKSLIDSVTTSLNNKYVKESTNVQFVYGMNPISISDVQDFIVFNFMQVIIFRPKLSSLAVITLNDVSFIIADDNNIEKIYADLYVAINNKLEEEINGTSRRL